LKDLFGYIPGISVPKPCNQETLPGWMCKQQTLPTRNADLYAF